MWLHVLAGIAHCQVLHNTGHKGPVKAYVQQDREGSADIYLLLITQYQKYVEGLMQL